jgi:hypothetical protein
MEEANELWRPTTAPKKALAWPAWASWLSGLGVAPALATACIVAIVGAGPAGMAVYASLKSAPPRAEGRPTLLAAASTTGGATLAATGPTPGASASGAGALGQNAAALGGAGAPALAPGSSSAPTDAEAAASHGQLNALTAAGAAPAPQPLGGLNAAGPQEWSAVAVAKSGQAFGVGVHQGSARAAAAAALAECAKSASNCELRKPAAGQCLALASAPGGRFDLGAGPTLKSAVAAASTRCRQHAGLACRLAWNSCAPEQP